jgi:hypothetical protein
MFRSTMWNDIKLGLEWIFCGSLVQAGQAKRINIELYVNDMFIYFINVKHQLFVVTGNTPS